MRKVLLPILSLVIAMGLVLPATAPVAANTSAMTYLGMNANVTSPFNKPLVRMAVYIALDRDAIAVSRGTKVVSLATPSAPNPQVNRSCNVTLARQMLTQAGYPNGFSANLTIPDLPAMTSLALQVKTQLYLIGINVTAEPLNLSAYMSRLSNRQLSFFAATSPVDNTIFPAEALGRLLLSSSPQNYTGYSNASFDSSFNAGQYTQAENIAFGPGGFPMVPLFYSPTPFYTIRVAAGPPTMTGVPIQWSKTGGALPYSGVGTTPFDMFYTAGNVTLTAPLTHSEGMEFYVFRQWLLGTPPSPPDLTTSLSTLRFAAAADKLATARYDQITSLGPVYTHVLEVNPLGTEHSAWVNIGVPVGGVAVTFTVSGGYPASGSVYTDAAGRAAFSYTGHHGGEETVQAYIDSNNDGDWDYVDSNGNGRFDPGELCEPRSDSMIESRVESQITGGGTIGDGRRPAWAFTVNLDVLQEGGVDGKFDIVNLDTMVNYRLRRFSSILLFGDSAESQPARNSTARFRGTGTGSDGSTVALVVIIEDATEPGSGNDKIAVVEMLDGPPPPAPPATEPWIGDIPFPPSTEAPTLASIDGGNLQIRDQHQPTPQVRPLPRLDAFQEGIAFGDWKSFDALPDTYGLYEYPATDESLKELAATGANWIELVACAGQETIASTTIFRNQPRTASDSELLRVVDLAHGLGMRVMLKPQLDLSNDPDHWRGEIGTQFTTEGQWQEWFASYREFINHYAALCQKAKVDMLCVGVELGGTTEREAEWRQVVQEVRDRFRGPLTYASLCSPSLSVSLDSLFPHGEEQRITWWDAVDFIGVDAYYQLTDKNDPTVEELKAAWTEKGYTAMLEDLSQEFNKKIIFTEIGYVSKDGANRWPGWFQMSAPPDLQEQADCYRAALEVLWGEPWLAGLYWWQWSATSMPWAETPQDKPAGEVLKSFYLAEG